ncbi:MAG: hypothetical protein NC231_12395 [Bacillus sp. (in: Bacteria)]|nr:hypothetical protein [Bacillus sp. (in: firmicutes)]MCM1427855.1 hypothetical protein [Eubacterium sp.]
MKSMEQMQALYEKEIGLSEQHKKKALSVKKEMKHMQGKNVNEKVKALNMSGAEYDSFIKLLSSDKKKVLEAVNIVLGKEVKSDADKKETTPD